MECTLIHHKKMTTGKNVQNSRETKSRANRFTAKNTYGGVPKAWDAGCKREQQLKVNMNFKNKIIKHEIRKMKTIKLNKHKIITPMKQNKRFPKTGLDF